jgi:hypothetical protein
MGTARSVHGHPATRYEQVAGGDRVDCSHLKKRRRPDQGVRRGRGRPPYEKRWWE